MRRDKLRPQVSVRVAADRNQSAPRDEAASVLPFFWGGGGFLLLVFCCCCFFQPPTTMQFNKYKECPLYYTEVLVVIV